MRSSFIVRLPAILALATCATLGSLVVSGPASAAVARVTCSSVVGIGDAKHPAIVTGCNDVAKTGGRGKLVAKWPNGGATGVWTFTWVGDHGTTTVRVTERAPQKNTCPKGRIPFVATGKVTGGTGSAHTVIPKGQTVSAHGCGNVKTGVGRLAEGTKLIL